MAQISNNSVFKLVLVLSFLLMICVSESKPFSFGRGKPVPVPLLVCNTVVGAESGDTCSSIAKGFGISLKDFLTINPNINCAAVFVGQWLCVSASA